MPCSATQAEVTVARYLAVVGGVDWRESVNLLQRLKLSRGKSACFRSPTTLRAQSKKKVTILNDYLFCCGYTAGVFDRILPLGCDSLASLDGCNKTVGDGTG